MNESAPYPVTEPSQVAEPRRVVLWLASHLDFPEERAGRAALVVSELATNLVKHARQGEILIRPLAADADGAAGIEILSLDKGPGMTDVAASRQDGHSTAGSLGHGLGAIERQADWTDTFTHTTGTVIAARVWSGSPPAPGGLPRFDVGGVRVSKPGEIVCGDAWAWRIRQARLAIFVADGLGHGLSAHEAAEAAVRTFAASPESPPGRMVEDVHAGLRATRGAAVAALAMDLDRNIAVFAGLGNIAGTVLLQEGRRHNMVSHNGTAGHVAAKVQEFTYPVPAGATIVMCSDGLSTHWDLAAYPGLRRRSPSVIAGVLYRDFSRRRDDVSVVVAQARPSVAEKL
jgi:anti-sigma regulatory factor (Ser/Thr protein kinase)